MPTKNSGSSYHRSRMQALTTAPRTPPLPHRYAGGFSIAMCCRLLIFLPGCLSTLTKSRWPVSSAGLVALATAFMYMIHKGLDFHGGLFLILALGYFLVLTADVPVATTATMPPPATW